MSSLGKRRTRSEIAAAMFKKVRKSIRKPLRPRSKGTEAVIRGVVVSGPQGPERKKVDVSVGTTVVSTAAPYIGSLTSAIAEGVGIGNRIGGRIHLKAIDVEINVAGNATFAPSLTTSPVFLDVMLVWDRQPDGVTPGVGSILVSTTTNLTFGNVNNLDRFQVLKRERLSFDAASGLSTDIHWHQALDATSRFGDATGAPQTNDYYIVAVSPNAAAGTPNGSIAYVARVTFTDA